MVNVQCGYRALQESNVSAHGHRCRSSLPPLQENYYQRADATNPIHTSGCRVAVEDLFNDNLDVILGVGVGLLVFQLFNIMLAGGIGLRAGDLSVMSSHVYRFGSGHSQGEGCPQGCEGEEGAILIQVTALQYTLTIN